MIDISEKNRMRIIKRYPNRKLYDTITKQYITLEEVAELIRLGHEVQVIDNVSEEDITTLTLTQIIHEQEKKQSGLFPPTLLANLIQTGGERLNTIQKFLSTSVNYWHQIDEEIRDRIQKLVRQGELSEAEGRRLIEKLIQSFNLDQDKDDLLQEEIQQVLIRRQVATRDEIQSLIDQIEELTNQLEQEKLED